MSKVDETPFLEPSSVEHLPAQIQSNTSSVVEWATLPTTSSSSEGESLDPASLFHSFRRHWLLAMVLGVILGGITTAVCLVFLPKNYTATAMVQVDLRPEESLIGNSNKLVSIRDYETFKMTQALSMRSPFVLNAALRESEVLQLKIYQREKNDPIKWLQNELIVSYPNDAELMQVSLTDDDKREVTTMVRAVVAAYMNEVVEQEKAERHRTLAELESIYAEKKNEARAKRDQLKRLAEQLNTADQEVIRIQSTAAMHEHTGLRSSLNQVLAEARRANAELAVAKAALHRLETSGVSAFELDDVVRQDLMCKDYLTQMSGLQTVVEQQSRVAKNLSTSTTYNGQFIQQYEAAKSSFEERKTELETQMISAKKSELEGMVAELTVKAELIEEEKKVIEEQFAESSRNIAKLGQTSVDIEIMRTDLTNLDGVLAQLNTQLERARLDLRNQSRIRIRQQAQEPESYDAPQLRLALAIIAGGFTFLLPLIGIVLIDLKKKRINNMEDVVKHLGLPVMGTVPVIPSRAIRRLNAPSGAGYQWNVRLTESIDSIAARLLRSALIDDERTVLITSAVSGEGKTTLAVQIAMSLARAGKRTVLVDFDLRRPAIDKAFQLPLDPGISEALCGEADIRELSQSVGINNLSVIPAGRCDRHALQALASGEDERILSQLKNEYDFVIIDGSPILPVADSRYIAQHVDSVVMSVFRDLSRAPKVMSAYNILKSFGVENVETVVASPCEAGYGVINTSISNEAGTA